METYAKRTTFWICAILFLYIAHFEHIDAKGLKSTVTKTIFKCAESYANNCSATYEKLDNGSSTFSLYMNILDEVKKDVMLNFQSYELKGGEFKKGLLHFEKSLCQFIESDMWLIKMVKGHSNIPEKCPIPAGLLYVQDSIAKEKSMPPGFQTGTWKFVFQFKRKDEELGHLDIEFKLE